LRVIIVKSFSAMVRGLVCLLYAHWLRNAEFDGGHVIH